VSNGINALLESNEYMYNECGWTKLPADRRKRTVWKTATRVAVVDPEQTDQKRLIQEEESV